jgi:predicted metal-binding membrane protein
MATKDTKASSLERMLMRDRGLVIVALSIVILGSWFYVLAGAGTGMSTWNMTSWKMALGLSHSMAMPVEWTATYATVMFFMWWIMMIAMMLPSAAPMILLHAKVNRASAERKDLQTSLVPTAAFTLGYLSAWAIFSAIATALQWSFEGIGVLSPMMMNSTNQVFAGLVLLFAGVYQLTPLKHACLEHCRSPIGFLSHHWRPGTWGAFEMGMSHGVYCLGCCWGLMAILFFGGIMNLYWIIGLALIVLMEKVLPLGQSLSYVTGGLLTLWGASLLFGALS